MKIKECDLVIIGAGCSGMAAAIAAYEKGVKDIIIIERSRYLGGVLRQCIHNGFGVHHFREDLTGTQYANIFQEEVKKRGITVWTRTIALEINKEKEVLVCRQDEILRLKAKAVILSTGCRERPRGALLIPGSRPAGVMTAGTAQRYMNLEGYLVGKRIVILGSGDIGLIMARQFVLEGAKVLAVCEVMPYSSGLTRNIVQCIEDFDIPLFFNTTVTDIIGKDHITSVKIAGVDKDMKPIPETVREIDCDALVLSVGLIPENELAYQAGISMDNSTGGMIVNNDLQSDIPGIFACGNSLHVHDLADFAAMEGTSAGENAAKYILKYSADSISEDTSFPANKYYKAEAGLGVRGLIPQKILSNAKGKIRLQFRPADRYIDRYVKVSTKNEPIARLRRQILTPGEMCIFEVDACDINDDIKVEVVEA